MEPIAFEVIIPVKNRSTLSRCIVNLLDQADRAEGFDLKRILVCDGGSFGSDYLEQLDGAAAFPKVDIVSCPQDGFNKGWLLNQGLEAATASWVLISDVDILWPAATLEQLSQSAVHHPDRLFYIQHVQESEPINIATRRPRYHYRLQLTLTGYEVEVYPVVLPSGFDRPGYGLVCAQLSLFHQIGGYRQGFIGWGWEDQDLLIRSQLLGYTVSELGKVIHLSHSDLQRNGFDRQCTLQESRDRNILNCLATLAQGKLLGDLPRPAASPIGIERFPPLPQSIHVRYPPQLHPCDSH